MIADLTTHHAELPPSVLEVLRVPDRQTVTQWAESERYLDESGAEPGRYSVRRTPYLQEPMDAFSDPRKQIIILKKAARTGGSEMMANMLGWCVEHQPGPALWVLPTEPDVKEEMRDRLIPMVEVSPSLREHVHRANWYKLDSPYSIMFDRMLVYFGYAQAVRTLIRKTIRYVFIDESDNIEAQSTTLGDPISLSMERIATYQGRGKVVINSSPSHESRSCHRWFEKSDRRRFYVACPRCGVFQWLKFGQIRIPKTERDPERIAVEGLAWYECEHCRGRIEDAERLAMVATGVWVPECQEIAEDLDVKSKELVARARSFGPDRWTPRLEGEEPISRIAGFHVSSLYSPWRSFSQIMAKYLQVKDDISEKQVFYNSWLGEAWKESVKSVPEEHYYAKIEHGHEPMLVPEEAVLLLMALDVQQDVLYYVIRAFSQTMESWLIDCRVIERNDKQGFEAAWHAAFTARYPRANQKAQAMVCEYLFVDSGYDAEEVYEFARTFPGVVPVKGVETAVYHTRPSQITPKNSPEPIWIHLVNTTHFKDQVARLGSYDPGHPSEWHLHRDTPTDYVRQITAEEKIIERPRKGGAPRFVWRPKSTGRANHFLDCEVYAHAGVEIRGGVRLLDHPVGLLDANGQFVHVRPVAPEQTRRFTTPDGRPYLVTERRKD